MITHSPLFRCLAFVPDLLGSASLASEIEELLIFTVNQTLSCLPIENFEGRFGFPSMQDAFSFS